MGGTRPMKVTGLLALVCAVALSAACNNNRTANREAGTTGTAGASISNSDKNFVSDQLSDGMAEVELAKVARDHAASADVKQFAQMMMSAMVDDHQDALLDLRSRVDENRSATDRLTGKNPENPAAVKPEQSDNRLTMSINEWAANTLPTVEQHLDRAKEIKDNVDHPDRTTRGTSGTSDKKPDTTPKGASKY